ncbi:hypothetical protein EK21DRAFT_110229 [Setomelanomma holmii]|uniref:Uncharacterized protein n=1 Tax=Setomelanomma holmii TaxID=210430 RepID=A0A9P4HDL1_9PLEO|nr:hypothetical protein EK21DRAFT_110229 [Setomelanomma holmii]
MLSTIPVILLALFSTVTGRPNLQRRGLPGAFYGCDGTMFQGNCGWIPPEEAATCIENGPLDKGLKSIGPDPDGTCTLYDDAVCAGKEVRKLTFPGLAGGVPKFGSIKCSANQQARAAAIEDLTTKTLNPVADPRLAGGVGSTERLNHLEELKQMEKDGFSEGLIGFKKGTYY